MLPVVWHPEAEQDLLEIVAFVAEHDYAAAVKLGHLTIDYLSHLRGRVGQQRFDLPDLLFIALWFDQSMDAPSLGA